ncbi:three-Cys-motif partner protein TcmP [Candidatus Woesearchaeota archaeon]|nr:three-Cys-motif partner protein TcmP [Candidatus Woesearchaeota archaeon]
MQDFFKEKQPWTNFKHEILKKVIEHKVFANQKSNLTYIDGLAGEGMYQDGEIGGPVVALNVFKDLLETNPDYDKLIQAVFFEYLPKSHELLKEVLTQNKPNSPNINIYTKQGDFYNLLEQALYSKMGHTLVFIDPFNLKGYDTRAIDTIRKFDQKTDVLIYFPHFIFKKVVGAAQNNEGYKKTIRRSVNIEPEFTPEETFQKYRESLLEKFKAVNYIPLYNTKNGEIFRMMLCTNDCWLNMCYNDFKFNKNQNQVLATKETIEDKVINSIPDEGGISYKNLLFQVTNDNFGDHKGKDYNHALRSLLEDKRICQKSNYNSNDESFDNKGIQLNSAYNQFFRRL